MVGRDSFLNIAHGHGHMTTYVEEQKVVLAVNNAFILAVDSCSSPSMPARICLQIYAFWLENTRTDRPPCLMFRCYVAVKARRRKDQQSDH